MSRQYHYDAQGNRVGETKSAGTAASDDLWAMVFVAAAAIFWFCLLWLIIPAIVLVVVIDGGVGVARRQGSVRERALKRWLQLWAPVGSVNRWIASRYNKL